MLRKLIRAWRQTDVNIDAQAAAAGEPAGVGNAITGAKNGLVLLSPGKRPAQADGRSEIVPVILVEQFIRLRRVFADKLHRGQLAPDSRLVPIRKARSREPEQPIASSDRRCHHSVAFIRNAVPLPSHAQIQCQIRTYFPIVLEEPAELVLMEIAVLLVVLAVIEPVDIFRIGPEAEGLANVRDR